MVSTMSDTEKLIARQKDYYQRITCPPAYLNINQSRRYFEQRLCLLDEYWQSFQHIHGLLCQVKSKETNDYFDKGIFSKCEENYLNKRCMILDKIDELKLATTDESDSEKNLLNAAIPYDKKVTTKITATAVLSSALPEIIKEISPVKSTVESTQISPTYSDSTTKITDSAGLSLIAKPTQSINIPATSSIPYTHGPVKASVPYNPTTRNIYGNYGDNNFNNTTNPGNYYGDQKKTDYRPISCIMCSKSHYLYQCKLFETKSIEERFKYVNLERLCVNCLRKHGIGRCQNKRRCENCLKPHHTMLHGASGLAIFQKESSYKQQESSQTKDNFAVPQSSGNRIPHRHDPIYNRGGIGGAQRGSYVINTLRDCQALPAAAAPGPKTMQTKPVMPKAQHDKKIIDSETLKIEENHSVNKTPFDVKTDIAENLPALIQFIIDDRQATANDNNDRNDSTISALEKPVLGVIVPEKSSKDDAMDTSEQTEFNEAALPEPTDANNINVTPIKNKQAVLPETLPDESTIDEIYPVKTDLNETMQQVDTNVKDYPPDVMIYVPDTPPADENTFLLETPREDNVIKPVVVPENEPEPIVIEFVPQNEPEPTAIEPVVPINEPELTAIEPTAIESVVVPQNEPEPTAIEPVVPENEPQPTAIEPVVPENKPEPTPIAQQDLTPRILQATAIVRVRDNNYKEIEARALLVPDATVSCVSELLVQRLRTSVLQSMIDGHVEEKHTQNQQPMPNRVKLMIRPCCEKSQFQHEFDAYVKPEVTDYHMPSILEQSLEWTHLKDLQLADFKFSSPGQIDITLGANVYKRILKEDVRKADDNVPIAQYTELGWVVSGPIDYLPTDNPM